MYTKINNQSYCTHTTVIFGISFKFKKKIKKTHYIMIIYYYLFIQREEKEQLLEELITLIFKSSLISYFQPNTPLHVFCYGIQ